MRFTLPPAQMARIGVAQALRWPTLTLKGTVGLEADDVDNFSATGADFWSIGANLLGPLFEFGRNERRVEVERARTAQAILSEHSLFNAELLVSSTLQQRYAALVQLYKALGGGWQPAE